MTDAQWDPASPSAFEHCALQVEGCPQQLLPLRSYYQRQHICGATRLAGAGA